MARAKLRRAEEIHAAAGWGVGRSRRVSHCRLVVQLSDAGSDQSLDQPQWRRLGMGKPDSALRGLIALQVLGIGAEDCGAYRKEAAVLFEPRVPDQRLPL